MSLALQFDRVTHRFDETTVLNEVSVGFHQGEIHALLGQNGAGKTTLMRLATGFLPLQQGTLRVAGRAVRLRGPHAASRHGIGMVHQHFTLVDRLSVSENLSLRDSRWWCGPRARRDRVKKRLAQHALEIDPEAPVESLAVGVKQKIEIALALEGAQQVLILDEPTAVLTEPEIDELFQQLRRIAASGVSILLITHKLAEVEAVADQITVLREGSVQLTAPFRDRTRAEWAGLVAGHPVSENAPPGPPPQLDRVCLRAEQREGAEYGPIDLSVRAGEVLGIAGVDGNGQTTIAEALHGLHAGKGVLQVPPKDRRAFISGDRQRLGLAEELSVAENAVLRPELMPRQWMPPGTLQQNAQPLLERFRVRYQSFDQGVMALSGGNQQKVILTRELASQPELIIAENPTRGLDLATTMMVRRALIEAAQRGAGVVLFSTDLEEILELSHRTMVAHRGQLHDCPADRDSLSQRMLGWTEGED